MPFGIQELWKKKSDISLALVTKIGAQHVLQFLVNGNRKIKKYFLNRIRPMSALILLVPWEYQLLSLALL